MKTFMVLVAVLLFAIGCGDDEPDSGMTWKKLGLEGKTVNEIQLNGFEIYVASTTGLYKKQLRDGSEFVLIGFNNKNVDALEIIDDEVIIASLIDKSGVEPPSPQKSVDGGVTWGLITSNFGGGTTEPVYDLESHPDDRNILLATGSNVIARSEDQGVTWQPIYGEWGAIATGISTIEINPNKTDEVWAGGQGAIENGFLLRMKNDGNWDLWNDLVDNPTVVKKIAFSSADLDQILVGWEGALLKTTDGGHSWHTLIDSETNRFFFGVCVRNGTANVIYAGGWLKTPDPQPLVFFTSNNGGETWSEYVIRSEAYGGIMDMQIRSEAHRDLLYVGLDKGGVYEVEITGHSIN